MLSSSLITAGQKVGKKYVVVIVVVDQRVRKSREENDVDERVGKCWSEKMRVRKP